MKARLRTLRLLHRPSAELQLAVRKMVRAIVDDAMIDTHERLKVAENRIAALDVTTTANKARIAQLERRISQLERVFRFYGGRGIKQKK